MVEQTNCHECTQQSRCKEVYEKLGNIQGPSVVFNVLAAFLLPIVVFIVCLAGFDKVLAKVTTSQELQTAAGFLLALLVTLACILMTRVINKSLIKNK
jgi:DMSO/TMAO reductase YedYZ heme-binding membrane subunit